MSERRDFCIPVERDELATRIAEAFLRVRRPDGASATEALDAAGDEADAARRAADAAMHYFFECIAGADAFDDVELHTIETPEAGHA